MVVGLLSIFQGPASTPLFIKHSFIGFMIFQPVTHLMLQIILCPRSAFSCEFADKVYIQIILLIQGSNHRAQHKWSLGSDDRIIGDQNRVRLCQPITNGPITANRGFILSLRNIQRLAKGIENAVELFYLFCIHINQFESFYKSLHVLYSGRRWSRAYPL